MKAADLAALATRVDLADGDIEDAADKIAGQVLRLVRVWRDAGTPEAEAMAALRALARRHHVALPSKDGFAERLNRMRDAAWWRRALRKRFRLVELQAIRTGAVHAHASPYVSSKALRRFQRGRRQLAALLATLEALNTSTGEVLPLEDVIASSQANPANRRMAMMARIKGIDAHARAKGHEALFLTLTAPSRMHARHSTGRANDRYDGTGPREGQAYLHRVWRKAMRQLQRSGLTVYGLRTVEPHHDACPHWHVLVYTAAGQADAVVATVRRHALADSPDEPGAVEHRLKVDPIDPVRGALAYVAKYVSKSIDGEGVGNDDETGRSGADAATSIVAWARQWGIRQFQFFGLPAITPMRELYRHDGEGLESQALVEAHRACKANDHAAYLGALEAHRIAFAVRYDERQSTRYPDELARVIRGLKASALDLAEPRELTTRTELWVIQPRQPVAGQAHTSGPAADPWTRFNNCAPPCESSTCENPSGMAKKAAKDAAGHRRRRPPEATTPTGKTAAKATQQPEEATC